LTSTANIAALALGADVATLRRQSTPADFIRKGALDENGRSAAAEVTVGLHSGHNNEIHVVSCTIRALTGTIQHRLDGKICSVKDIRRFAAKLQIQPDNQCQVRGTFIPIKYNVHSTLNELLVQSCTMFT
jgi:chromosome segregation ATPase